MPAIAWLFISLKLTPKHTHNHSIRTHTHTHTQVELLSFSWHFPFSFIKSKLRGAATFLNKHKHTRTVFCRLSAAYTRHAYHLADKKKEAERLNVQLGNRPEQANRQKAKDAAWLVAKFGLTIKIFIGMCARRREQCRGRRRRGQLKGRHSLPKQHKSNFEQHLSVVLPTSMPFPVTPSAAYWRTSLLFSLCLSLSFFFSYAYTNIHVCTIYIYMRVRVWRVLAVTLSWASTQQIFDLILRSFAYFGARLKGCNEKLFYKRKQTLFT